MGVKAKAWDIKVALHNDYSLKVAKGDDAVKDELLQLSKERDALRDAFERLSFNSQDSEAETYHGTLDSLNSSDVPALGK